MDAVAGLAMCGGVLVILVLVRVVWELTKGSNSGGGIPTFPDGWSGFDG